MDIYVDIYVGRGIDIGMPIDRCRQDTETEKLTETDTGREAQK